MMMHFWIWMNRRADSSWIPWADYTPHQELVLAVFAGWGYMLYFASGFEATGPLVVMILRMLFHDVLKFMLVYLFVAIAFAQALYLLMLHEPDEELTGLQSCNFCSVSDSLLTLFRFTVGDMDFGIFRHPTAHRIVYSIFIAWALASNILMVNLLIALMNSTYESIKQEGQKVWFRKWARLVLLMERRLPVSLRHRFRLGELHYYHGVKEYVYTMTDSEDADLADGGMELKSPTAWGEQDMYSRFHNLLKKHFEVKKSQGKSNKARQELGQAHANVNVQYYANQFQRAVKHSPG
uniref:Transient receptor potential cation channel subfamily V member 3 n=1 Tax=Tetraselmis sp. GSL018 TaxID=582737 RepID=A0A061QUV8_9CHLO